MPFLVEENKKVVLYARVSKDDDGERYQEPENQLVPLREFAKSFGYEVVGEYVDKISGASADRPQFKEMKNQAMLRKFNGILVWSLDRFSREGILITMSYIQELRNRGIFIKSHQESWLDTQNEGITDLLLSIFSWVAHQERQRISQRTKAGIQRLKNIGQWKGGRPPKNKGGAVSGQAESPIVAPPQENGRLIEPQTAEKGGLTV